MVVGKEGDKEKCRDEAEELVGNKSLGRFIKWSFSHCRLKASGSAYGGGGAERKQNKVGRYLLRAMKLLKQIFSMSAKHQLLILVAFILRKQLIVITDT